jgi:hypothetical protein
VRLSNGVRERANGSSPAVPAAAHSENLPSMSSWNATGRCSSFQPSDCSAMVIKALLVMDRRIESLLGTTKVTVSPSVLMKRALLVENSSIMVRVLESRCSVMPKPAAFAFAVCLKTGA